MIDSLNPRFQAKATTIPLALDMFTDLQALPLNMHEAVCAAWGSRSDE
jgi:hypothetical protein